MDTKKYLYAAVGAPVVAAKAAQSKAETIRTRLNKNVDSLSKDAQKQLDEWVKEGETLIGRLGESPAIDEISERVDLDQVQEQVSKLRDQLEDLLATWRNNFRPGTKLEVEVSLTETEKPAPAKTTGTKATSTSTGAKTASAGTAAKKPAAKKPAAKKPAAKKPAAKKPAAKKPAAKKPAAKATSSKAS